MACNRETSADNTTSSAPPACQNPDALVPCCNNNCHFFGCAATMNLCSKCYSEHILKEGSPVFLNKPSDATVIDPPIVRLNADHGAGEAADSASVQMLEDAPALAMPADASELLRSQGKSMNRSIGVSNLHAIFRSAETSRLAGDMSGRGSSDVPQHWMPSPLSLPSTSLQTFSPVRRQVETKLSMPPLPPRQQAVSRCLTCRKRVGLLGFKCRCGDLFCALHRHSERHDCSFDYKAAGRAAIAKENPVVKASKIEKI